MFKPEILAPVGNREMLTAAVFAGADAVYLGLDSFNARRNAENFTVDSLAEAVEFCHVRGVKVYLTLNIIIGDREMKAAVESTVAAAKCGIDGIITADIGFARVIHKVLPELPLHASTQMTVHSPAAIKPLKEMGFCRVVVSREMTADELKEFCKEAEKQDMEVEVFVHGALCMSMSGQCLLSAMLGGRSGNRGLCAGPCRLPFKCEGGSEYALSLKDLSLVPYLGELRNMGVASLKIEGRMKRPEYVAAAVHSCKAMLERGFVAEEINSSLERVFSRSGFTDGYYKNRLGADMFGIRTKDDVMASADVMSGLHSLYRNELQRVGLKGEIIIKSCEPIKLSITDGKNTVNIEGNVAEKAINRATDRQTVKDKLCKTGGTPYFFEDIGVVLDEGLSVRVSELNSLRREALEAISALRAKVAKIKALSFEEIEPSLGSPDIKRVVRLESLAQLTEKAKKADLVVLPIGINEKEIPNDITVAVELPRGISNEGFILKRLEAFKEQGITTAFCGTLAADELAKRVGFNTVSDFGFNIYNSYSAKVHKSNGAKAIVLSPELLLSDAARLCSEVPKGIISYGRLPLMLTRNCPVKALGCDTCQKNRQLLDRMGVNFPVRCKNGYSELFNSRVIWLADKARDGLDFEVLYFTDESSERVDKVLTAYEQGSAPDCEYTRGLYFRGVE